jgi:hypothetical protein
MAPYPGQARCLAHRLELVRQRLDVGHRHARHLVGEGDIDAACLHAQPELTRVAVKPQPARSLDDLDTGQLRLS